MKRKIVSKEKYDTDRYEMHFRISEDDSSISKSVWEANAYVGPESYNNSHIDKVFEPDGNRTNDILSVGYNPYIENRAYISKEKAKFTP